MYAVLRQRWFWLLISALVLVGLVAANFDRFGNLGLTATVIDSGESLAESDEEAEAGTFASLTAILERLEELADNVATSTTNSEATEAEIEVAAVEAPEPAPSLSEAVVNLHCSQEVNDNRREISGTGFLISDTGVVLTNAHMAQFLLLEQASVFGEVECVIRSGANVGAEHSVELLYISPRWIIDHADLINDPAPRGTGENDFALLYIDELGEAELSSLELASLSVDTALLSKDICDETVILAGYPGLHNRDEDSYQNARQLATTTVAEVYTFGSGHIDLFTLNGSSLGEQGASGGPVLNAAGKVIGVISTRANDEEFGEGSLRAISLSYIDRTIRDETNFSLHSTISGDLDRKAEIFNDTLTPILTSLLAGTL